MIFTNVKFSILMNHQISTSIGPTEYHHQAIESGKFLIQKCNDCFTNQFFPRSFCITCTGTSLGWEEACGRGIVYSTTTIRRKIDAGGDYNVCLVDLEEGVRLMGNVIDIEPNDVYIGQIVHLKIETINGLKKVVFKSVPTK